MTSAMTLAAIVGIQQAAAQGLPAPVVSCMDEHDAAKRLACYDREVPRAVAASAGASPSAAATTPAVRTPSPQSTTALASSTAPATASTAAPRPPAPAAGQTSASAGTPASTSTLAPSAAASGTAASASSAASEVDAFGMTAQLQRKESGATAPPPLNKLTAHIAAVSQTPRGEFIVTLDNGQVWEETETVSHLPLRTGDSITIKRGMLGSFYMSSEQVLGLRVRRVR
jgi:hypothetical protein